MKLQKAKYAVLIYPYFSLQEITCLTSCLSVWFEQKIDIIASERKAYSSEDFFQVVPNKTLDEVDPSDYDCIILPGIINPLPALHDERIIEFLKKGKSANTLFAAISSSPLLLAKAGLLDNKDFTAGFFMQMADIFPFISKTHFRHKPIVEDGNVITAIGMFFREFAEIVLTKLGYNVGKNFMLMDNREYSEEALTFYWTDADYQEFLGELKEYAQ